jgi:hypothetical protein
MATQSKNFVSFVALGGQNPQILSIDFLKANQIIEVEKPPFDELVKQDKPPVKFISVPSFTNLVIGKISFIVDEQRFIIREDGIQEWSETKILDIADKYFRVLPYTPLKVVGINFNSLVTFDTPEEAKRCQELCLGEDSKLAKIVGQDNILTSCVLRYEYGTHGDGRITLRIEQPNKEGTKRQINFNYEFDFTDWDTFRAKLQKVQDVSDYCDTILDKIMENL